MEQESKLEEFENELVKLKPVLELTVLEAGLAAIIVFFGGQILSIPFGLIQLAVPEFTNFTFPVSYAVSFVGGIFILNFWKKFGWDYIKNLFTKIPNILYLIISIFMFMSAMPFVELTTSLVPTSGLNGILDKIYEIFIGLFESVFQYKIGAIISVCILAPVLEEVILRGIILKGMLNKKVTPWIAIVVSALLFGIIHANPWQFVAATLMGIILGFVYYKTNSLWICIILHALNNSLATYFTFKYGLEEGTEIFDSSDSMYITYVIGGIILSIGFGFLLHFLTKKNNEQ